MNTNPLALLVFVIFLGSISNAKVGAIEPAKNPNESKYAKQCLLEAKSAYKQKNPNGKKVTFTSVKAMSDGNGKEHYFSLERPAAGCPMPGTKQGSATIVACVSVSDTYPVATGYCQDGKVESITIW